MRLAPLQDFVLIKQADAESKSKGGIILPENAQTKSNRGVVTECGPGTYHDGKFVEVQLKKGDTVIYSRYSGQEIEFLGEKLILLRESEVFGRVVED